MACGGLGISMENNQTKIGNYWVTSDTHFNHRKLEEYGRPEGFEVEIIKGLQQIPEGSILLHLGDFCIGAEEYSHAMFMGATHQCAKRILVRGNHDGKAETHLIIDEILGIIYGDDDEPVAVGVSSKQPSTKEN